MKASQAAMMSGLALLFGVLSATAADAPAAQAPAPQARDLEPAVNTSAPAHPRTTAPATAAASHAAAPDVTAAAPGAAPVTAAAAAPAASGAVGNAPRGRVMDRLNLDATQVTGNSELPKVLYIVPWKRADLGDLNGKPMNSLLDEVLTPIDRDVFRRENRYFDEIEARQAAPSAQGTRDEK